MDAFKKLALILVWTTATSVQAACPSTYLPGGPYYNTDGRWTAVDGRCFSVVETYPTRCDEYCIANGGRWATISSKAQNDYFISRGMSKNTNIWIGLTDSEVEGTFQWTNPGDSVTYTNWDPEFPINDVNRQCVMMNRLAKPPGSYLWLPVSCEYEHGKILCGCVADDPALTPALTPDLPTVQAPTEQVAVTVASSSDVETLSKAEVTCPASWESKLGKCYLTTNPKMDYPTCLSHCADLDATLPCVMNEAENTYLAGVFHNEMCNSMYLGLNDIVTEGVHKWQEGCFSTYRNFLPGEPNNWQGAEHCTALYKDGQMKWNDMRCSMEVDCVCEKAPS